MDRTITHLTYISKQETFEEDFLRFIRTIFASDKDAELFETSKKNTIEKFRKIIKMENLEHYIRLLNIRMQTKDINYMI